MSQPLLSSAGAGEGQGDVYTITEAPQGADSDDRRGRGLELIVQQPPTAAENQQAGEGEEKVDSVSRELGGELVPALNSNVVSQSASPASGTNSYNSLDVSSVRPGSSGGSVASVNTNTEQVIDAMMDGAEDI